MPLERPTTNPDDLYYRDRVLATTPFNPGEFAKTFEHRRVRVQDVNLHYVIGGQGPVIVFGHGWPASWYEWRKVMPQLIDRFTCVAFDLPGLGDSSPREHVTFVSCSDSNQAIEIGTGVEPALVEHFPDSTAHLKSVVVCQFA